MRQKLGRNNNNNFTLQPPSFHRREKDFEAFVKLFTESTNLFRLVLKGIKIVKNHFTIFRNVMAGWSKNINLYTHRKQGIEVSNFELNDHFRLN